MLLKDNEEKRNIAWRTVMTVTSVLIILIVVFFAVKLFTSNPLTGNWENTDDGMKLTIKNNGTMDIVQTAFLLIIQLIWNISVLQFM